MSSTSWSNPDADPLGDLHAYAERMSKMRRCAGAGRPVPADAERVRGWPYPFTYRCTECDAPIMATGPADSGTATFSDHDTYPPDDSEVKL